MTEKRFELVFEDYDTFSIRDNDYIKENKHYHTLQEIVELLNQLDKDSKKLNELHEENQRLKSIFQLERRDLIEQNNNYRQSLNERLRKENNEWVVDYNGLHTECAGCQEENKSLRQKVDFYKDFQKDARELEKENEELRQFKQLVFNSIDKSLKEDKRYYKMTYEDYLNGRIEALEELKKVIMND